MRSLTPEHGDNSRELWEDRLGKYKIEKPPLDKWQDFLSSIPPNGRVLELGAGRGDFSYAMHEMRPDITFVVMDQAKKILSETIERRGIPLQIHPADSFADFEPTREESQKFDGVFANNALFFADTATLSRLLGNVALSMKSGASFEFNYIEPTLPADDAQIFMVPVFPIPMEDMRELLIKKGFEIDNIEQYFQDYTNKRISLPTMTIKARKRSTHETL